MFATKEMSAALAMAFIVAVSLLLITTRRYVQPLKARSYPLLNLELFCLTAIYLLFMVGSEHKTNLPCVGSFLCKSLVGLLYVCRIGFLWFRHRKQTQIYDAPKAFDRLLLSFYEHYAIAFVSAYALLAIAPLGVLAKTRNLAFFAYHEIFVYALLSVAYTAFCVLLLDKRDNCYYRFEFYCCFFCKLAIIATHFWGMSRRSPDAVFAIRAANAFGLHVFSFILLGLLTFRREAAFDGEKRRKHFRLTMASRLLRKRFREYLEGSFQGAAIEFLGNVKTFRLRFRRSPRYANEKFALRCAEFFVSRSSFYAIGLPEGMAAEILGKVGMNDIGEDLFDKAFDYTASQLRENHFGGFYEMYRKQFEVIKHFV